MEELVADPCAEERSKRLMSRQNPQCLFEPVVDTALQDAPAVVLVHGDLHADEQEEQVVRDRILDVPSALRFGAAGVELPLRFGRVTTSPRREDAALQTQGGLFVSSVETRAPAGQAL